MTVSEMHVHTRTAAAQAITCFAIGYAAKCPRAVVVVKTDQTWLRP